MPTGPRSCSFKIMLALLPVPHRHTRAVLLMALDTAKLFRRRPEVGGAARLEEMDGTVRCRLWWGVGWRVW